jgi:hypothetical protein
MMNSISYEIEGMTHLVVVGFLGLLELFLEEERDFFDVTTGGHAQDDTHRFAANFHVSTGSR